jgi:hypothetical protein
LLANQSPRDEKYLVEFQFAGDPQLAEDPPPRRRRRTVIPDPEPVDDWFVDETHTPEPPRFRWDVEIVAAPGDSLRDEFVEEVSWTARTESFNEFDVESDGNFASDDLWQPFDETRLTGSSWNDFNDHQTIAASSGGDLIGEPLQESLPPESAESLVDLELELSWNRPASRRRRAPPQLYLRNLGPQPIPQVDVIAGPFPDDEAISKLSGQTVLDLAPEDETSVTWPGSSSGREIVSVLVTAFVGSSTVVAAPPASRPQSRPELRIPTPAQPPPREPDRPHLTLTIGVPGRLAAEKMISVPMQVVNDGNVPLDDVVIVADVPAQLQHRFGRKVQYVLGRIQPGEVRPKTLLLTPLEAGTSYVPLRAVDGRQSAEDSGEVRVEVAASESEPARPAEAESRTDDEEIKPEPPRRRRSRERESRTK